MRPIKFRCFNKLTKRFEEISNINISHNEVITFFEIYGKDGTSSVSYKTLFGDKDEFELMQFTGLHDCKGNPIYESDILQAGRFLFVVVYDIDSLKVKEYESDGQICFYLSEINKHSIVVSTIHENPELLETK